MKTTIKIEIKDNTEEGIIIALKEILVKINDGNTSGYDAGELNDGTHFGYEFTITKE